MEKTIENKVKFFALYFGQKVFMFDENHPKINRVSYWTLLSSDEFDDCYLELKNISSITDEDAIEVALLCGGAKSVSHGRELLAGTFGKHFKYRYSCRPPEGYASDIIDFVRSKGYAVPYMNLNVRTLIEYGWVKVK